MGLEDYGSTTESTYDKGVQARRQRAKEISSGANPLRGLFGGIFGGKGNNQTGTGEFNLSGLLQKYGVPKEKWQEVARMMTEQRVPQGQVEQVIQGYASTGDLLGAIQGVMGTLKY